jgi:hypothetical protein
MSDILTAPCRANERSKVVYFFNGGTCCDVQSGTEEQQRAAFLLVSQAQEMARLISDVQEFGLYAARWDERAPAVLRSAGVMSDSNDRSGA